MSFYTREKSTIFTVKAQSHFFEINLTNFISTISDIQSSESMRTKSGIQNRVEDSNRRVTRSVVKVKVKPYVNSTNGYQAKNIRVIQDETGIYLTFSVSEWMNTKYYDIFLMKKIGYTSEREFLLLKSYSIAVDDMALTYENLRQTLSNGVQRYKTKSKFGMLMKMIGKITLIVWLSVFGVSQAIAYFF